MPIQIPNSVNVYNHNWNENGSNFFFRAGTGALDIVGLWEKFAQVVVFFITDPEMMGFSECDV
jgi:hypothetical protein